MNVYIPYPGKTLPYDAHRLIVGWSIVIALYLIELLAVWYGKPSVLSANAEWLSNFVEFLSNWVTIINSFAACNLAADAGTGLMISLSVLFFPMKLAALYYAYPSTVPGPEVSWKQMWGGTWLSAAWNSFYSLMIAAWCLVFPAFFAYGPVINPAKPSIITKYQRKALALCDGDMSAFLVYFGYSAIALACMFMSLRFISGSIRRLKNRVASQK